jgi:hypothetical protein
MLKPGKSRFWSRTKSSNFYFFSIYLILSEYQEIFLGIKAQSESKADNLNDISEGNKKIKITNSSCMMCN